MQFSRFAGIVFVLALLTSPGNAAQPWDSPFAADVAAILKAANQVKTEDDAEAVILLEDQRYVVGADGHVRGVTRRIYQVRREDAVDGWSAVEQNYQPWRDAKPVVRARVIARNGDVHILDSKTIADSPVMEMDSSTFSDARVVRAPLPAVAAGSVVEYEISTDESPALAEAGVSRRIAIYDSEPVERFHFEISAPQSVALATASQQIAADKIHRSTDKQTTRVEFDLGPISPRKTAEINLPFELSAWPYFSFTTGKSWQAIAASYAEVVEKQIQAADLKTILDGVDTTGEPAAVVARLASQLHRKIRYTGVEFGEAAIVPARPGDVLQRRFGDCKDKSTLLVAMLRSAGLKANVALLRSGFGTDVDKNLPGMDWFDHAIVVVNLPQHPLWLDATASDMRIGELPYGDQGRLALIAARETTGLVTIPEQKDGWERRTYEVRFSDFGPGRITEIMEAHGPDEANLRARFGSGDNPKPALEKYVKNGYRAKSLGRFAVEGGDDLSQPVRVSAEAVDTPQVVTDSERAEIILGADRVLTHVPWMLWHEERETALSGEKASKRTQDYLLPETASLVHIYKLYPPPQYQVTELPASARDTFGPLTFSRDYKRGPDGEVDVEFRAEIGNRRWTAEEYEQVKDGLHKLNGSLSQTIQFVPATAELVATGEFGKAIALVRDDAAKHADAAAAHIRYSRLLVTLGLGQAARAEARKATALNQESGQAWQALAWALQHDTFGRLRQGDWDRAEAIKALRKAIETDPEDMVAKTDLAILLDFNANGERYGKGADLAEAAALYREVLDKHGNPVLETNLTSSLFYGGKYDEAKQETAKCPDPQRILFRTALLAMQEGAAKAIVNLQSLVPDTTQRPQLLIAAALVLTHALKYHEANAMMQAAQRLVNSAQLAPLTQMLARAKSLDEAMLPAGDPRAVVQKLFAIMTAGNATVEDMKSLVASHSSLAQVSEEDQKEFRSGLNQQRRQFASIGLTSENLRDLSLGSLQFQKKGEEQRGFKIFIEGNLSFPPMYVTREGDGYKLFASSDSAEDVGTLALELLKQNDIAGARWWLDLVTPDIKGQGDWISPAKMFWPERDPDTRGAKEIRLAALALIGHASKSPEAIQALTEASKNAKSAYERGQFEFALCDALEKSAKWADLAAASKQLLTSKTFDDAGFAHLMKADEELRDWKGMETSALERIKSKPKEIAAWRSLAAARIRLGNTAGANEALDKLKDAGGESDAKEMRVWNQVLAGKVTEETLATLKTPREASQAIAKSDEYLAGFAAIKLSKTDQALDSLKAAIGDEEADALDARAWVLYGDICEQYGFEEAAADSWKRAREAKSKELGAKLALSTLK